MDSHSSIPFCVPPFLLHGVSLRSFSSNFASRDVIMRPTPPIGFRAPEVFFLVLTHCDGLGRANSFLKPS